MRIFIVKKGGEHSMDFWGQFWTTTTSINFMGLDVTLVVWFVKACSILFIIASRTLLLKAMRCFSRNQNQNDNTHSSLVAAYLHSLPFSQERSFDKSIREFDRFFQSWIFNDRCNTTLTEAILGLIQHTRHHRTSPKFSSKQMYRELDQQRVQHFNWNHELI